MFSPIFSKVLVANRGEIAVRVQLTLQSMGVGTIAVYSKPDSSAPHVALADEAYPLLGSTAEETYLDIDKIIAIAHQHRAEAIHPGYGFLSESPQFARACREAGIVFIGPSPESMAALGNKVRSKELASQAAVPVVPSSPVCQPAGEEVARFGADLGYPLLVKAAAGGGGRGMRLVTDPKDLAPSMESAQREAAAAFGDGRVFLESYIPRPRHVEFQILADHHGHVIHLLERECSIQRRHQKIIEETPSAVLTPELRQQMGEAAVAVAQAAGYQNAGTAEFLLDDESGQFYFLEMNTRLQVEHPITEAVLGLDLVEWQVRIAAGEPLTLEQADLHASGHAVECRIYAEDPYNNFAPSAGRLTHWLPPSGPGLRLDSGVAPGQEISTYYDPMLAKLIAWGPDRPTSLRRMELALSNFPVLGLVTNIPFLREVIRHPHFQNGQYDITFLENTPAITQSGGSEETRQLANALAGWAWASAADDVTRPGLTAGSREPVPDSPWRAAGPRQFP